ncbi:MAG: hypothetical protein V2J25_14050 [Desulfatiglans sp.]|nr:hypothetical protein [Thermodesulfobacteriota bacterium]MEE4353980.1 hypothetical protein [Desulfatiglans sp.]
MEKQKKTWIREEGKIYFTRETEKRIFFGLTLIMLLLGILAKIGLF